MTVQVKSVSIVLGMLLTALLITGFLYQSFENYHLQFAQAQAVTKQFKKVDASLTKILIGQLQQEKRDLLKDARQRGLTDSEKRRLEDINTEIRELRGY